MKQKKLHFALPRYLCSASILKRYAGKRTTNLFKRKLLPYLHSVIFTYVYFLPQSARVRTFVTRNTSAFERRLRVILRETYVHYRTSYQVRLGFASNGIVVSTVRALATKVFSCPLFLFPSSSCIFTLAQFVGHVECST